jgi:hypothetical protein
MTGKKYTGQQIILTYKDSCRFVWAGYIGTNCLFIEELTRARLVAMGFSLDQLPTEEKPRRHFRMVEE